ncbi:amidase [Sneathiella sp. P13V-1]|uniref:amidase n=1 Tax=Sneathiella sp. P13V-1 TaxID=2697366 RepID=UPI00187B1C7A|nr:amidase family protein [Sneathiella sp. P13V-1]MBE7636208.1 amidase [Sneathiella sp. P13V-1]
MTKKWHELTALQLGDKIAQGEINPVELTQYFLTRIKEKDPDKKIYVRLTEERAMKEAEAAKVRADRGERLSPLDGVPISWKDLFDTAGVTTEAGCQLLEGRVPEADAECLTRATRAGLICLGKTNMPDLAFSGLGNNPWTGTGPNPHDTETDRVPGGSSSGAALSVYHGLAAAGIGSDTAGSVRIPSAWCGITGLKTTHGLISLEGSVPLSPTQDTVGPLTRDVADANALCAILSGKPAADLEGASLTGVRILKATTVFDDLVIPEIKEALDVALDKLRNAGAEIVEGPVPAFKDVLDTCNRLGYPGMLEGYALYGDMIRENPDRIASAIGKRFMAGENFTAAQAIQLGFALKRLTKEYVEQVADFDLVVGATQPDIPPILEKLYEDNDYYIEMALMSISLTRLSNLLGLCATSLPAGFAKGFPVGMMLMAPGYQEGKLLRLSKAVEDALSA